MLLILATCLSTPADGLTQMSAKLAALRAEVESLSTQITQTEEENSMILRSLVDQKTELELQARREEIRLAQVDAGRDLLQAQIGDADTLDATLVPIVQKHCASLADRIATGLPFQRNERRQAVKDLEARLTSKRISARQAVAKLWVLFEDELRLTRENGLHQQEIEVGGDRFLADVIHLGMVALYFKTPAGEVGFAQKHGDAWKFVSETHEARAGNILALFDGFQKGIRSGTYTLPNAFGEVQP